MAKRGGELTPEEVLAALKRGAAQVVTEEDLVAKLRRARQAGRPLRGKLGMDPSAPDVHLGHTVVLRKLRQFQDLGHEVDLVIGDFTGRIGDPSGESETRPQLSEEVVRENARTYAEQVFKVLDPARTRLLRNNDWLGKLRFADVVTLAAKHTVARMLERDDYRSRFAEGRPLYIHEFLYPLAQAYDSVHLRTDLEFGGTDQTFNLVTGRDIMRHYGLEPQCCLTMPLLEGLDGQRKMSKSLGNYIGVNEPAEEMYGKTMSLPDPLIIRYFELVTGVDPAEVERLRRALQAGTMNPRDAKMRLAREIVGQFWGTDAAERAEAAFVRVFQQGRLPEDIPEVILGEAPPDLAAVLVAAGLAASRSEARRLVEQGGVRVDGARAASAQTPLDLRQPRLLQVGKRRVARVRLG